MEPVERGLYDREEVGTLIHVMLVAARGAGGNLLELRDAAKAIAAACEMRVAGNVAALADGRETEGPAD